MSTALRIPSFWCCGVRLAGLGRAQAVQLLAGSRYGAPLATHLCNAYTLSLALRDEDYRRILNSADANISDGHYVALVGRRRGQRMNDVRGPQLMLDTIQAGLGRGVKHYLYGASPRTVNGLANALRRQFPDINLVGVESPPFANLTTRQAIELEKRIAEAEPDIVWVGLGTPRQDVFVYRFRDRLNTTLVPVGAAFDFHAGNKRTAPEVVQRAGMEWLFRFANEPRRLWRRYLIGNAVFLWGVLTDRRHD